MSRADLPWLRACSSASSVDLDSLNDGAKKIYDILNQRGASFPSDLTALSELEAPAIEDALWELVAAGLATADGFACMRVLIDRRRGEAPRSRFDRAGIGVPARTPSWQRALKKARSRDIYRPKHGVRAMPTAAGRWSVFAASPGDFDVVADPEASARQLLYRYGVVFRDLLGREHNLPPWRELLMVLRRLEARGEIRGGRFVKGFVGEQFALPEALDTLRAVRNTRPGPLPELVRVSATDPLNLVGVTSPGPRVAAVMGNAVLYRDGVPIASLEAGKLVMRHALDPGEHVEPDLTYIPPPMVEHHNEQGEQVTLPFV
jgi:ATP-dependent Lhr-like helicase